jgi:hypothetical protein
MDTLTAYSFLSLQKSRQAVAVEGERGGGPAAGQVRTPRARPRPAGCRMRRQESPRVRQGPAGFDDQGRGSARKVVARKRFAKQKSNISICMFGLKGLL